MTSPTIHPEASQTATAEDFQLPQPPPRQCTAQLDSNTRSQDQDSMSHRLSYGSYRDGEAAIDDFHPEPFSRQSTVKSQDLETTIHGSCPRCHHWHDANVLQLHISRRGTFRNKIICKRCQTPWFHIGGHDTAYSLISQETDSNFGDYPPSISESGRPRLGGCSDYVPPTPSKLRMSFPNPGVSSAPLSEVDEERSQRTSTENVDSPSGSRDDQLPSDHVEGPCAEAQRSTSPTPLQNNGRRSLLQRARQSRLGQALRDFRLRLLRRGRRPRASNILGFGYSQPTGRRPSTHSGDPHAPTPDQSHMYAHVAPAPNTPALPGTSRISSAEEEDPDTRQESGSPVSPLSSAHPLDSPIDDPIEPLGETRNERISRIRAEKRLQARTQHGSGCHCSPNCPNCSCNTVPSSDQVHVGNRSCTARSERSAQRTPSPAPRGHLNGVGQWLEGQPAHPEHLDLPRHRESMVTWDSQTDTHVSMELDGVPPRAPTPPLSVRRTPPLRPSIITDLSSRRQPAPNRDIPLVDENEPVEEINDDSGIDMDSPPGPQHARTWPVHRMA